MVCDNEFWVRMLNNKNHKRAWINKAYEGYSGRGKRN